MHPENTEWNAPEVTPLTEADGSSSTAQARIRNGGSPPPSFDN